MNLTWLSSKLPRTTSTSRLLAGTAPPRMTAMRRVATLWRGTRYDPHVVTCRHPTPPGRVSYVWHVAQCHLDCNLLSIVYLVPIMYHICIFIQYIYHIFRLILIALIITYFIGCIFFFISTHFNVNADFESGNTFVLANNLCIESQIDLTSEFGRTGRIWHMSFFPRQFTHYTGHMLWKTL